MEGWSGPFTDGFKCECECVWIVWLVAWRPVKGVHRTGPLSAGIGLWEPAHFRCIADGQMMQCVNAHFLKTGFRCFSVDCSSRT